MTIAYNLDKITGTFNGINAGVAVAGNAISIGNETQRVRNLAAVLALDIETSTLTATALWQVSNDKSTWVDVAYAPNNAAAVVFATGTGGADPTVTKIIPAPDAVYGYRFARISVVMGVTNGTTNDTYEIGYSYRRIVGGEVR